MNGSTDPDFWIKAYKEQGLGVLEEKLVNYKGSPAGNAIEQALKNIDKEQRDKEYIPKIKREREALGWARIGAIAAVVAIPVALVSIGLTYWLAKSACS